MNKNELVQQLAARTDLTRAQARRVVDSLFSVESGLIPESIRKGESVSIARFGRFDLKKRVARKGRNPRAGKRIDVGASTSAAFRPGKPLKEMIGTGSTGPRRSSTGSASPLDAG